MKNKKPIYFLLAHQDDEFGCFYEIERLKKQNQKILIIYLTENFNKKINIKRNEESLYTLKNLGVDKDEVIFLAQDKKIYDGFLSKKLRIVFNLLLKLSELKGEPSKIYTSAWEGGHQDHDAAHLIGIALAKKFFITNKSYQFPLYTGVGLRGSFFRLFKPILENGKPIFLNIPFLNRIKYLRLSLSYPTQLKTWIGLFPFFLFHYIFFGTQIFQPISLSRPKERPHQGKLLYERRFSHEYEFFKKNTSSFIKKYI